MNFLKNFFRGPKEEDQMQFIEDKFSTFKVQKDDPIRKMPHSMYDKYFLCESFTQFTHTNLQKDMNVQYIYNITPRSQNDWNLFCDEVYDILLPIQNEMFTPGQKEHFKNYLSISHEILVIALENARKNNYGAKVDKCNADKFLIGRYDVVYGTEESRNEKSRNGVLYESFDWLKGSGVKDIDDCLSNSEIVIVELNVGMYVECSEGEMEDKKKDVCFYLGYKNNGHACALIFYPQAGLYTIVDPNGLFASEILIDLSKKSIETMLQRDEVKSLSHCKAFIIFPNKEIGYNLQSELEDPETASAEKLCLIGFNGICQTVTPLAVYTTIKMNYTHPLIVGGAITSLIKNKKLDRAKLLLGFMSTISKNLPDNWTEVDEYNLKNLIYRREEKIDLTKLYERPVVLKLKDRFRQFKLGAAQKAFVAAQENVNRLKITQSNFESKALVPQPQFISQILQPVLNAVISQDHPPKLIVAAAPIPYNLPEPRRLLHSPVRKRSPYNLPEPRRSLHSPVRKRAPLRTYSRSRRSGGRVRKNYPTSRNFRKNKSKRR